jgi:signal transduction histidine kinase
MIDECITSFNSLPNFNIIDFKKEIQSDLEFHSAWTLLTAIMQNLLENAIKYSSKNFPFVAIRVFSSNDHLYIEVSDNGQGILLEHQPRIFEMFFRATKNATGTGLGLYILKRSVDRLNGSVALKSEVGQGSTFTVKLPLS